MRLKSTCLFSALLLAVVLAAPAAFAATYVVTQSGLTFSPADLTIAAGDSVRWNWTTGIHTVTSGDNAASPDVGSLFDAPLSSASPSYVFVFANPGVVPYFCRPHELFGMKGTITVQAVSAVGDLPIGVTITRLDNAPNPFNPQTVISFDLAGPAPVELRIYDLAGRRVRSLLTGDALAAGPHDAVWDGRTDAGGSVAAGVYLYVLRAGSDQATGRMALVK